MFLTNEFFSRNTNSLSISEDVLCKECSSSSLMNKICFNRSLNGRRRLEKEEQVLAKKMLLTQLFCILISYERNWLKVLLFHFRVSKFSHPFASCLCDPSSFLFFTPTTYSCKHSCTTLFYQRNFFIPCLSVWRTNSQVAIMRDAYSFSHEKSSHKSINTRKQQPFNFKCLLAFKEKEKGQAIRLHSKCSDFLSSLDSWQHKSLTLTSEGNLIIIDSLYSRKKGVETMMGKRRAKWLNAWQMKACI